MWAISFFLIFLAGSLNACMDVLRFRYKISIFRFCKNQNWVDPNLSWVNKWKYTSKFLDLILSTVLVWTTDLWHLFKTLMLLCIFLAIVSYSPLFYWYPDLIIINIIFSITFELFFCKLLIKKS